MKYFLLLLTIVGFFWLLNETDRRSCMLECRSKLTLDGTEDDCERICQ